MLLLSRKQGEKIVISDQNIVVTVLEVAGNRIRLGITAPDTVRIHREEILLRTQSETPQTSD